MKLNPSFRFLLDQTETKYNAQSGLPDCDELQIAQRVEIFNLARVSRAAKRAYVKRPSVWRTDPSTKPIPGPAPLRFRRKGELIDPRDTDRSNAEGF